MPSADRRDRTIARIFDYIDIEGTDGRTAEVSMTLGTGDFMTVRAGGQGIHALPASAPFETYEVLTDHDPPRFWSRYTDSVGAIYAHVPRLLIAHHITRHGGIEYVETTSEVKTPPSTLLKLNLRVAPEKEHDVLMMLQAMVGVDIIAHSSPLPKGLQMGV